MFDMKEVWGMNKAARQYTTQFSVAMAAYVVTVLIAITALNAAPQAPWRYAVVALPVIPALLGLMAFIRFLGRMDELQRRIQLEAIAFSFGVTGILTFAYGFLQLAGLPALSWIWIFPAMVALWGIGVGFASRRYA